MGAAHILAEADLAVVRILVVEHDSEGARGISAAALASVVARRVFTLAGRASHRSGRARP